MALFPTKKITALTPAVTPLTGFEEFECVQLGNSRKVISRDFVLPIDSILTISAMGGSLPGSRQITSGIGIAFIDGGPGSTFSINATGAVAGPANPTAQVGLAAVNGVAVTYMRSDAAPPLDQGITPTWTALHTFNLSPDLVLGATFLDQAAPAAPAAGRQELFSSVYGTSGIGQLTAKDSSAALIALGYETHVIVYNNSGAPLVPGSVVYVSGTFSGIPTVALAQANSATTMPAVGMVQYLIPNNSYGRVHAFGPVAVSTVGFVAGQTVYVSDSVAGGITNTAPTGANLDQAVGTVTVGGSPTGSVLFSAAKVLGTAPSTQIGLTVVNGVAATYMRSDAAPALSQAIAPTWTAQHIFSLTGATNAAIFASSAQPQVDWNETDAAANNRRWRWEAQGEQFLGRTVNDANSAAVTWIAVDRTLNVVDTIALTSTALTWNGNPLLSTATAFANPSATIGLATVNGVATTAMRSDAAPALSQAIAPTWTAQHIFSLAGTTATPTMRLSASRVDQEFNETDAAADNRRWFWRAESEQFSGYISNDASSVNATWLLVDRTGTTVDSIAFTATAFQTTSLTTLLTGTNAAAAGVQLRIQNLNGAADNRLVNIRLNETGDLRFGVMTDALVETTWLQVNRTGGTVDLVGFPVGTVRVGGNQTETISSSPLQIGVDGVGGLGIRNCTADVEALVQCGATAFEMGTRTAHGIDVYTGNSLRFTFGNAAPTTGASTPTLSANKPGANAGVITWISVLTSAGTQGWVPVFGN